MSVLRDGSRSQQSRKGSLQCLLVSFGSESALHPFSCCIWKHCLAPDFFRVFCLFSPAPKAAMVTYPHTVIASAPQLTSHLVVFLKITIAARRQIVDMQHMLHIMLIYCFFWKKKKNCSMKSRGQISDPVKFMAQCQFIWKNHTFVPKFYKSLTTICFLTCYSPLRWYSFFGISNYHYCCCCYYSRKSVWEERWNLV